VLGEKTIFRALFLVAVSLSLRDGARAATATEILASVGCAHRAAQILAAIPHEIDPKWHSVPVGIYEVPYWNAAKTGPNSEIHIGIGDPHNQIDDTNPLPILFSDKYVNQRLKIIDAQLEASKDRVKVYLDRWNTRTVRYSECPSCFSLEEVNGKARFSVVLLHPLDEHPEVALHGIITGQMFDSLHEMVDAKTGTRRYEAVWREQMTENLSQLNVARRTDSDLDRVMANLGEKETANQIEQIARLQLVWGAKIEFYRSFKPKHPELAHGRLAPVGGTNKLDAFVAAKNSEIDDLEIQEFIRFYSQNQTQNLDPVLIRRAWNLPRPPLWEAPVSHPTLVALPPTKPPAKTRGKEQGASVTTTAP
jgi:hypothetical protein